MMTAIVLVIAGVLYFLQRNPVLAMFGDQRTARALNYVWGDVLPKSNAGRSYRRLLVKHVFEINRILKEHPEHVDKTSSLIEMFLPVLEAQPGDEDDASRMTTEQIDALQVELNWLSSFATVSLRNDIEREQNRFPFKDLVGMTLYEALDYADSHWSPATVQLPSPTPAVTPTLEMFPIMPCIIGVEPGCLAEPLLVPNSEDGWAYHVMNGVYFEYPSDWRVEQSQNPQIKTLYFLPPKDSFEELNTKGAFLTVRDNASPNDSPPYENAIWIHQVSLSDFEGYEFLIVDPATLMHTLHVFLYNKDRQQMIYSATAIHNDRNGQLTSTWEIAKENFPNFHHMIENIKIEIETGFVVPTATAMQNLPPPVEATATAGASLEDVWTPEIINGVYFEHPGDWVIEEKLVPEMTLVTLVPPSNSFEGLSTRGMFFGIRHFSFSSGINYDEIGCTSDGTSQIQNVLLRQQIDLPDFKGNKAVWKDGSRPPVMYIESVIYNKERQIMICWITVIDHDPTGDLLTHPENVDENYPTIQRVLESIKIWDE